MEESQRLANKTTNRYRLALVHFPSGPYPSWGLGVRLELPLRHAPIPGQRNMTWVYTSKGCMEWGTLMEKNVPDRKR